MRQRVTQPTTKTTVRLPHKLLDAARRRAQVTRRSLNQLYVDAVQREVSQPEVTYETERDRVTAVLREGGMLMELGSEWDKHMQGPIPTLAQVRKMLEGQPPISQDIIEMRMPR